MASAAVTSTEKLERNFAAILGLSEHAFRRPPTTARQLQAHVKQNRFAYLGAMAAAGVAAFLMSNGLMFTDQISKARGGFAQNSLTIPIAPPEPEPSRPVRSAPPAAIVDTPEPVKSDETPTKLDSRPKRHFSRFVKTRLAHVDQNSSRASRTANGHGRQAAEQPLLARQSPDRQPTRQSTSTATRQSKSVRVASAARNQRVTPLKRPENARPLTIFDETTVTATAQISRRSALDALRALRRQ